MTLVQENIVEVSVADLTPEIQAAVLNRYGPEMVRVRQGSPVQPDACSRTNCGPPWRGGLKIIRNGPRNGCTANFVVRYYSGIWNYAIWTSGHCGDGTWKLGSESGTTIGTTASNNFSDGSDADVQVTPISAARADDDYLEGIAACSNCTLRDVRTKEGKDGDQVGEMISNNVAYTGKPLGTIAATNFTFVWEE